MEKVISRRGLLRQTFGTAGLAFAQPPAREKRNVLFIVVDDLRPELGCYGNPVVKTPNIDRLARRGVTFTRAYCQQSVCTPSRTSFLTGLRPDTTKVIDNGRGDFRKILPDVVTLPQFFRQQGYETRGLGKIFGEGLNDPKAWSVPLWPDEIAGMQYVDLEKWSRVPAAEKSRTPVPTLEWEKRETRQAPEVPDNALQDGQVAERAVQALPEMRGKPFCLAVGFLKPHLPFVAPKKYFDLYSPRDIPEPPYAFPPKGAPEVALHPWVELRGYTDIPKKGPLPPGKARELIHGYYAATSYTDAQVGKVLDELDRLNLASRTVVVLLGDNGWHLGEHDLWVKTTNFEFDTRVPLIFADAGVPARGVKSPGLVEFVDVYPTLCDLCGCSPPQELEGLSMAPLLAEPARRWKKAAFSQFPRPFAPKRAGDGMGYTVRTERYRYTEWRMPGQTQNAVELYDHEKDPFETVNVADRPENRTLLAQLQKTLQDGWRAALPPGIDKR
ncbi:MAG: sulfatase [Acidobacteria bacterium]|nr:sulfatase [Acidobacteriota bacterium]